MVDYTVEIKDRDERNRAAKTVLRYMQTLNPQVSELDDYMHRLYDQLIIMSDYKLDIDSPYPVPERQKDIKRVKPFEYHTDGIRFRYYGRTLEAMIKKATEMEDGEEKNIFLNLITVQMKKSYYLWNADILTDEMVAAHLELLSGGRLQYTDAMRGEVYANFYNKPSLEHKSKYINVSAYENTGRRNFQQQGSYNNRGYNNNGGYAGGNRHNNGGKNQNTYVRRNNNNNNNNGNPQP